MTRDGKIKHKNPAGMSTDVKEYSNKHTTCHFFLDVTDNFIGSLLQFLKELIYALMFNLGHLRKVHI